MAVPSPGPVLARALHERSPEQGRFVPHRGDPGSRAEIRQVRDVPHCAGCDSCHGRPHGLVRERNRHGDSRIGFNLGQQVLVQTHVSRGQGRALLL